MRQIAGVLVGLAWATALMAAGGGPLRGSRQAIVITTTDWDAVPGTLQRFERTNGYASWKPVGPAIHVVVGKSGLGWGIGLHGAAAGPGPVKKEGDNRAPAGVFAIPLLFGYLSSTSPTGFRLPYHQATDTLECVDDPASRYYNQIVDRTTVPSPDWKSSEHMHRPDELYRWGAFVAHNSPHAKPGAGSCIFLHIAQPGLTQGTEGCSAMQEDPLLEVLRWLDPLKQPRLVQLPDAEYRRLRRKWKLPAEAAHLTGEVHK